MSSLAPPASLAPAPADRGGAAFSRKKLLLCGLLLAAVVAAVWLLPTVRWLKAALEWMRGLGPWGAAMFVGVYVGLSVVALPTSLLNLGAGVLWGVVLGFLVSLAAATASNTACFVIARYVARDWITRRLRRNPKYASMLDGLQYETWKVILLTRLNPLLPSAVAGYCFGVTPVRFRTYLWASVVGNAPLCLLLAYFGSAGHRALGVSDHRPGPMNYTLWGLVLVSTLLLTVWLTRYTSRKLKEYRERGARGEVVE